MVELDLPAALLMEEKFAPISERAKRETPVKNTPRKAAWIIPDPPPRNWPRKAKTPSPNSSAPLSRTIVISVSATDHPGNSAGPDVNILFARLAWRRTRSDDFGDEAFREPPN
jgi:hypothetical protein